jgi:hypothetical protein
MVTVNPPAGRDLLLPLLTRPLEFLLDPAIRYDPLFVELYRSPLFHLSEPAPSPWEPVYPVHPRSPFNYHLIMVSSDPRDVVGAHVGEHSKRASMRAFGDDVTYMDESV